MGAPILKWLLVGAATVVVLQLALVVAMLLRGAWAQHRIARWRHDSRILDEVLDEIEAAPSVHVRRELVDARIGRDLRAMEAWLDAVAARGHDPAALPPECYEDAGLVEHYLDVLADDGRWTRRAIAAAILGWTRSPRAVGPLLERVQDVRGEMPAVRAVALRALGRVRHPDAVRPLVDALASDETWLPPAVAAMLVRLGDPARDAVVQRLADEDEDEVVRRWAAQILGDMADRRALPVLLRSLDDVDPELRARAAYALGSIGDDRAADRLLERLLVDPVPFVRVAVARALAAVADERAMQRLVEALADPEWWVRLRAVEALGSIGVAARDLLVATLSDPDPQVRRETARALEEIGVLAEAIETLRRGGYDPAVGELLVEVGRAGNIEPLLDELESGDEELLQTVVRILGRVGDVRAGRELATLLERDVSARLRGRVLEALVRVGDGGHTARVLPLLRHDDEWVRKEAVDYVAVFGDESVVDDVLPLVDDPNPWTREAALRVLERVPPPIDTLPRLVRRAQDDEVFVRARAVRVLCALGAFDAIVTAGIHEGIADVSIRDALLEGLHRTATPDALVLVRYLAAFVGDDDLQRVRYAARTALEALDVDTIDALILDAAAPERAPSHRWLGAVAWERASDDAAQVTIDLLLEDEDPRVRAAMVHGLGRRAATGGRTWISRSLADPDPLVIRAAIAAAVRREIADAASVLNTLARHDDPAVRVDAILARGLLSSRRFATTPREGADGDASVERLAATIGRLARGHEDAVLAWIDLLGDRDAMRVFHRWIDHGAPLVSIALERTRDDAGLAARLLRCHTPFEAERVLIDELESSPDPVSRGLALEGIVTIGSERGTGRVLAAFLRDAAPAVRARALRELVITDAFGRGRRFLEQAFLDPTAEIQVTAAQLCAGLPARDAVALLVPRLVTRRPTVQRAVVDILAGVIGDDLDLLLDAVGARPPRPEILVGMIRTLGCSLAPIPDELLDGLLAHRTAVVRAETLRRLVPRRPDRALEAITRGVADPTAIVRDRALQLLGDRRLPVHEDDRRTTLLAVATADPSPRVRSRVAILLGSLAVDGGADMLRALRSDEDARVARLARRIGTRRREGVLA